MSPPARPDRGAPAWRAAWARPAFRRRTALALAVFAAGLVLQGMLLPWIEDRPGAVLPDPILARFAPRDFSTAIFVLVYGGILLGLVAAARTPRVLTRVLLAYGTLVLMRMGVMLLVPLDPPATIIPLRDPVVSWCCEGRQLTRDLFFSGHTATLFLLHLSRPRGALRVALLAVAAAVAVLTTWQHSHYVIDVVVAPLFAWAAWRLAGALPAALGLDPHPPAQDSAAP